MIVLWFVPYNPRFWFALFCCFLCWHSKVCYQSCLDFFLVRITNLGVLSFPLALKYSPAKFSSDSILMSFQVRPCGQSDFSVCCAIQSEVNSTNPLLSIIYTDGGTEALQKNLTYHMQRESRYPDVHIFCAVDTTNQNKLIAFAKWVVIDSQTTNAGKERDAPNQNLSTAGEGTASMNQTSPAVPSPPSSPPPVPPSDTNGALFNHFITAVTPLRSRHWTQKTLVLDDLCVLPSQQWRGAGKLLLQTLIDFADEQNLPCYIESTPVAYDMYLHQGFREVDTLSIDLGRWRQGGTVYRTSLLYRDAKGCSKTKS